MLPYLYFGLSVRGQAAQTYLNHILVLQKRDLQLIHFAPYRSHAISLFHFSNSLPIDVLYLRLIATLMHDVSNNLALPTLSYLFSVFCDNSIFNKKENQNFRIVSFRGFTFH